MNKVNLRDSQVLRSGDGVSSMSALQGREVDLSQVKWAEGGGSGRAPGEGGGGVESITPDHVAKIYAFIY